MMTTLDVRDVAAVEQWMKRTLETLGGLDGLANVAGVCRHGVPLVDVEDEDWDVVMGVNAKGTFNCMRAAVYCMQSAAGGGGGGAIVNVASIAGWKGLKGLSVYCASKHAVIGMSKAVAMEVGGGRAEGRKDEV